MRHFVLPYSLFSLFVLHQTLLRKCHNSSILSNFSLSLTSLGWEEGLFGFEAHQY